MLSRRLPVLVASFAMLAAAALPASSAAAPTGTSPWRVSGARDLGALPARPMTVTLVLAPRHAARLGALVARRHAALSPAAWRATYAPSTATLKTIRAWARAHGLRVRSVSSNRLLVRLSGSSTALAKAFGTSLHRFGSTQTGSFFQVTRRVVVPRSFAGAVSAVLGFSNLGRLAAPRPAHRSATSLKSVASTIAKLGLAKLGLAPPPGGLPGIGLPPLPGSLLGATAAGHAVAALPTLSYPAAYGPQDFWAMYDAPSSQTGSAQHLAIITEGDVSQPKQDLVTFEQKYGLPAVTWNQINVGTPSSDTSGADEWDLDSQYSTGFAPGVSQLDVYVGPSLSDQDILATINRWVTDDISKQGSFSAGECELLAYAAGFTSGLDTVLKQAAAQGQTMFFSSGDTGSQCPAVVGVNGVPVGIPGVNYPASSPYGIGVGGTSVLSPSGPTEIAWYAGGGGSSLIEPTPAFQSGTNVGGVLPLARRGVPDVSLDADPESGYDVVVGGTVQVIGGTSASAPSWQGIWARAQGAHGGSLGFGGPILYQTEPATSYHDITLGSNGFPAHPGWDYATGLGTPDIAKFVGGA